MWNKLVRERKEGDSFPDTAFSFDHQMIFLFPVPAFFNNFADSFYFICIISSFNDVQFRDSSRK